MKQSDLKRFIKKYLGPSKYSLSYKQVREPEQPLLDRIYDQLFSTIAERRTKVAKKKAKLQK